MRLTNIFLLIFVMTAFAIGASLQDSEDEVIINAMENASVTINNITLGETNDTYTNGILRITETYIHFVGTTIFEVTKLGMFFGKENPEYFEPSFIVKIIKLLIWLAIISLLIQPMFYLIIFIVMLFLWLKEKIIKRRAKKFAVYTTDETEAKA